jgi:hypothetical protein
MIKKIKTKLKSIYNIFIPKSEGIIKKVVSKVKKPIATFRSVPAPVILPEDPWFGKPVLTKKRGRPPTRSSHQTFIKRCMNWRLRTGTLSKRHKEVLRTSMKVQVVGTLEQVITSSVDCCNPLGSSGLEAIGTTT